MTVAGAGETVRVPFARVTLQEEETSVPSASKICQDRTVLYAVPGFVWEPEAVALKVKPSGRPVALTRDEVSAFPSYASHVFLASF